MEAPSRILDEEIARKALGRDYRRRSAVPWFSFDWAAAGLLIDALQKKGLYLSLISQGDGNFRATFLGARQAHIATTGPLAVSLAALTAVEYTEDKPNNLSG